MKERLIFKSIKNIALTVFTLAIVGCGGGADEKAGEIPVQANNVAPYPPAEQEALSTGQSTSDPDVAGAEDIAASNEELEARAEMEGVISGKIPSEMIAEKSLTLSAADLVAGVPNRPTSLRFLGYSSIDAGARVENCLVVVSQILPVEINATQVYSAIQWKPATSKLFNSQLITKSKTALGKAQLRDFQKRLSSLSPVYTVDIPSRTVEVNLRVKKASCNVLKKKIAQGSQNGFRKALAPADEPQLLVAAEASAAASTVSIEAEAAVVATIVGVVVHQSLGLGMVAVFPGLFPYAPAFAGLNGCIAGTIGYAVYTGIANDWRLQSVWKSSDTTNAVRACVSGVALGFSGGLYGPAWRVVYNYRMAGRNALANAEIRLANMPELPQRDVGPAMLAAVAEVDRQLEFVAGQLPR
jgi:hypothetical protein